MMGFIMESSLPVLPDMDICRAKENGLRGYVDCLVIKPAQCRYALAFGQGYFCCHPNRRQIIQNTFHIHQQKQIKDSGAER